MKQLIEEKDIIEHFANLEHERWSKWQKYMHSKFVEHSDGKGDYVCLPTELFRRWERQINTPYADLSEQEKQSDREQVMPYVNWHKQSLKQFIDELIKVQNEQMQKELSVERFARPDFYKGYEASKNETIARDVESVMKDVYNRIGVQYNTYVTTINNKGVEIL